MDSINSEEISLTIQQIKEGPKAKLRELCKKYGLPISGTRVYFQRVLCQRLGIDPKSVIVQKPTSRSNSHGDCCSVAGCRSRRGKDTHIRWFTVIRKKGSHTAAITKAIQLTRKGWTPTMYSRICGQHFSCGQLSFEPSSPDYIPHLHMDPAAKATTSCPTFWSKESSEEAMDLTNKGSIKSIHVAGPSHLDYTNQYYGMHSSGRSLVQSAPERPCISVAQDTRTKDEEFLSNSACRSPGTWEEDGDASEEEMDTKGGWPRVLSREPPSEALDFSTTNRAKAERRLELSTTVNESSFGQRDSFGRQSDVFNNKEQTLLHRGHMLSVEDTGDYMSSGELVAVPLEEDNDEEVEFHPVRSPHVQVSQSNQTREEENGVEQTTFKEAEEKRRKSKLDELTCRKQSMGSSPDECESDGANNFEKRFLLKNNDCNKGFDCENGNRDVHKTILSNRNEDSSIMHNTQIFNIAENGNDILRTSGNPALSEEEVSATLARKAVTLKESLGFPVKRLEKDFVPESRLAISDGFQTLVDPLPRRILEEQVDSPRAEAPDKGKIEKNRKAVEHEDIFPDEETHDIDDLESEATITAVRASSVEKSSNSLRYNESSKNTRMDFMSGMKIKDEPLDEGYEKALLSQTSVRIKDEPDSLQVYGQHSKPQETDLQISAVFSVSGRNLVSQMAQQNSSCSPLMAKSPLSVQPTSSPAMSVRVTCSGCKKILQKGQTAYQRKGSTQLFCSTLCLTGFSASISRPLPPAKKYCYLCSKEITNPKDLVMGQIDGRGPYKEFCNHKCLIEMKRKPASVASNITTKCSICQKLSVVRHEVNYQNVVHKLCSDICFSKFRMANNLTMNCCDNCGAYCYSGSTQCHMLQTEGQCKKFCGSACLSAFKQVCGLLKPAEL